MKNSKAKKTVGSRKIKEEKIVATAIPFNRLSEGKTISISNLPDCDHGKFLTSIVQDPKRSKICVVAFLKKPGIELTIDTWTAYAGYPDARDLKPILPKSVSYLHPYDIQWLCEHVNDVMAVTMLGQPLERSVAVKLFPDWEIITYRRE